MRASGISSGFPGLSQSLGQVANVLLTRSPLGLPEYCYSMDPVRLACVKHAASVRPEPESNSPSRFQFQTQDGLLTCPYCVKVMTVVNAAPRSCARTGFWRISVPLSRSTTGAWHTPQERWRCWRAPARFEGCSLNYRGTSSVRFIGPGEPVPRGAG